jgi:HD-GYP domain-containing protein (c-di-GMP phosphodiesterase class II)
MEDKSKDIFQHSERTAILCYATAKELNLYADDMELAYLSGLLHEIGKLDIPNEVQVDDQFIKMEKIYPYFTVSILNNFDGFDTLSSIIMKHQENIDGSGSPKGLKGDEIDLVARILRIADFYDHQRMKGLTHDETTKSLRENSDVIFPRQIITPFIKAIIKNDLQYEYNEIK